MKRSGIPCFFGLCLLAALDAASGFAGAQCRTSGASAVCAPAVFRPAIVVAPVRKVVAVRAAPVVLVPKALAVAVTHDSRESYYSASDGYRDSVIADAAALRALRLLAAQQLQARPQAGAGDSGPVPRMKEAPAEPPAAAPPARPAGAAGVPAGLQQVVERACAKCHAGTGAAGKNGIGLDDLAAVPRVDRLESFVRVNKGDMPKGGKPLTDEETALFEEWASSKSAPASWPAAPPRTLHEVAADAAPEAPRISERRKALIARAAGR